MSVDSRLVLTQAKADIEHDIAPTSQQAARNQGARETGIEPAKPLMPFPHRTCRGQIHA
jgi:hypothetical protein